MENQSILIVEDNGSLRRFMAKTLEKVGFRIVQARSGAEAYAALPRDYYDLVLLDLALGDADGIDILKTIRRQDELLPVIVVSSCAET